MRNEEPRSASLCYRFEYQKNFRQLDFGGYWYSRAMDFGIWYRGLPVFKRNELKSHLFEHDAIVLSMGLTTSCYHIGYSYDLQLSGLSTYGTGAHEISLILETSELFGCGLKYLDCFKRRQFNDFNENRPRNMKLR
jgi:hypothetical protein